MDDGNDDSGGDGNDDVHGDDDGDEDDGEDDDVDDDGAFADDGDGHDQRSWKEFDVRACAWPAWYLMAFGPSRHRARLGVQRTAISRAWGWAFVFANAANFEQRM